MLYRSLPVVTGAIVALMICAAPAIADSYSDNDAQFLAALDHGGVCCPWQPDTPIWHSTPGEAIANGRLIGKGMTENPTYQQFSAYRDAIAGGSQNHGTRPMNGYEAGEFVVIAVRYYAPVEVERQLIAEMGEEAGYWYGQEVRTQMVPVR